MTSRRLKLRVHFVHSRTFAHKDYTSMTYASSNASRLKKQGFNRWTTSMYHGCHSIPLRRNDQKHFVLFAKHRRPTSAIDAISVKTMIADDLNHQSIVASKPAVLPSLKARNVTPSGRIFEWIVFTGVRIPSSRNNTFRGSCHAPVRAIASLAFTARLIPPP